ncbi:MAG: SOS response-associated peptidase [Flavobacteriaceae bacterium]|nr:SOS response-associated peptidase [Flavobacteriaceae bacterium]
MCGRYNITKKIETVEKELSIRIIEKHLFDGLVNLGPGSMAPVLCYPDATCEQWFQFGLTPHWAKKRMYVFNARTEGDFNKENSAAYRGAKGIIQKPMFRKPIRSQRCLVIASSYIEGPSVAKLNEPYLVFKNDFSCFTFAGIYDQWVDVNTGEIVSSFAIITTAAPNAATKMIDHARIPIVIAEADRNIWLDPKTPLDEALALLRPQDTKQWNAFPIDKSIKNPRNKDLQTLRPTGEAIKKITHIEAVEVLELLGMGETRARQRRDLFD